MRTSFAKTRQANRWHHLPAYSCSKQGIAPGGGGVPRWRGWGQHTYLVGCRLPPLDGYMAVYLYLTIAVYANRQKLSKATSNVSLDDKTWPEYEAKTFCNGKNFYLKLATTLSRIYVTT